MTTSTLRSIFFLSFALSIPGAAANETAPHEKGLLEVAVASGDITPPIGVPLAGHGSIHRRNFNPFPASKYVRWLKGSNGILDPIRAKVMLLKRGDKHLVFVSVDLVAVTGEFRRELAEKLVASGIQVDELFVSGTHTHNGPGNIARNKFWQIVAVDKFMPEVYNSMLEKTVALVERALIDREPGYLLSYSFRAIGLQANRRADHSSGLFDPNANVMLARTYTGEWLGAMVNLAIHGTALHPKVLLYSADVPGGIEHALEARLEERNLALQGPRHRVPTVLFINGAEGDVAPALLGVDGIRDIGQSFAEQALEAERTARLIGGDWEVQRAKVALPKPRLTLKGCLGTGLFSKLVGKASVSLKKYFPVETEITTVWLGDMAMVTWPGEPTTSLGFALKEMAAAAGSRQTWVLGLTNDHLSYFVTEDEFAHGGYESCSSLYGAKGAEPVLLGYKQLLGGRKP